MPCEYYEESADRYKENEKEPLAGVLLASQLDFIAFESMGTISYFMIYHWDGYQKKCKMQSASCTISYNLFEHDLTSLQTAPYSLKGEQSCVSEVGWKGILRKS